MSLSTLLEHKDTALKYRELAWATDLELDRLGSKLIETLRSWESQWRKVDNSESEFVSDHASNLSV